MRESEMTPDEIEKGRAPERIWIDDKRTYSGTPFSAGVQYVRADLFDAMTAERDAALALVAAAQADNAATIETDSHSESRVIE